MSRLFVLRAYERIEYDCPDNGLTHLDDKYTDVAFSTERDGLDERALDLNRGHAGYWTVKRADKLRTLYSGYDNKYEYKVEDVSDLVE